MAPSDGPQPVPTGERQRDTETVESSVPPPLAAKTHSPGKETALKLFYKDSKNSGS